MISFSLAAYKKEELQSVGIFLFHLFILLYKRRQIVMSKSHGTLQVTIVEGRHLKDEDIVGKNDAFVEVYLDKEYKQRTKTVNNSNDPKWDEKFTL